MYVYVWAGPGRAGWPARTGVGFDFKVVMVDVVLKTISVEL